MTRGHRAARVEIEQAQDRHTHMLSAVGDVDVDDPRTLARVIQLLTEVFQVWREVDGTRRVRLYVRKLDE